MPPWSPLEIPEILDKIASHLIEKDLACCVCVSKSWRDSFLPYRWRYIRRVFEAKGERSHRPDQAALHSHRHFVEELTIRGDFGPDKSCAYPNLRTMRLFCYDNSLKEKLNKRRIIDLDLAEKYPSLNHLSLDYVYVEPQLCRALSKHPTIRNLSLDRAEIKSVAVQDFFKACKNLESLSMNNSYVNDESIPVPKDLVFERMRELNLSGDKEWFYSRVLAMVFHCPVLTSFLWENGPFIIRISINHPIKKHHQPRVTDLKISRYPEDTEWASILGGIGDCLGDITHLRTRGGLLGPQASKALGHHFSTLVELAMSAESSTIRDVLCSCPKLEILTSLTITAGDIAESGPWVCQQLRELRVSIIVQETERDLQPVIFERLSALVRLEWLGTSFWSLNLSLLEYRLDCGLQHLASLQKLRTLQVFSKGSLEKQLQSRKEDVEWMVHNWKELKNIKGCLNADPEIGAQIKDVLTSHGVATD